MSGTAQEGVIRGHSTLKVSKLAHCKGVANMGVASLDITNVFVLGDVVPATLLRRVSVTRGPVKPNYLHTLTITRSGSSVVVPPTTAPSRDSPAFGSNPVDWTSGETVDKKGCTRLQNRKQRLCGHTEIGKTQN